MGIFFILLVCIMYEFSVVLALITVSILFQSVKSNCKDPKLYEFIKLVNILPLGLVLAFDKWPHFLFPIKLLFSIGPILVLCV